MATVSEFDSLVAELDVEAVTCECFIAEWWTADAGTVNGEVYAAIRVVTQESFFLEGV